MTGICIPLFPALAGLVVAVAIGYGLGYRAGCRHIARHVRKVTLSPSLWGERFESMKQEDPKP